MAFWERNTIILAIGTLIGGLFYFSIVLWQSLMAGSLVAPSLWVWLGYIVLQFCVSMLGMWPGARRLKADPDATVAPAGDERDRLIRMKSEAVQGHVMSGFIFLAMAAWFLHANVAILFHSLVAALIVSELARAAWQLFNYNRAI
ncbi:MAG: hypothetical protein AAFR51_08730 [Pseudomonadota bacterium]